MIEHWILAAFLFSCSPFYSGFLRQFVAVNFCPPPFINIKTYPRPGRRNTRSRHRPA